MIRRTVTFTGAGTTPRTPRCKSARFTNRTLIRVRRVDVAVVTTTTRFPKLRAARWQMREGVTLKDYGDDELDTLVFDRRMADHRLCPWRCGHISETVTERNRHALIECPKR